MKKFTRIFTALVVIAMIIIVAVNGRTIFCDHEYSVVEETAATCSQNGSITWECAKCGKQTTEATPVDADAHEFLQESVVDIATCIAEGKIHYHCDACGQDYDKTLPIDPDNHVNITPDSSNSDMGICLDCGAETVLPLQLQ